MKKTVTRYGIYSGLAIVVLFLLSWLLFGKSDNYDMREVVGYASMVISLLFVFFGIKHYRDHENGGQLTFGQGMKVGLLIVLVPSLAFGLFNLLYVLVLEPNFVETYYQQRMAEAKNTLTPEKFEAARKELESMKAMFANPLVSSLVMALTVFFIGVIVTVIGSLILRRKVQRAHIQ